MSPEDSDTEVANWVAVARAEADHHEATDLLYAELMTIYAELGELLLSGADANPHLEQDTKALLRRADAVRTRHRSHLEQRAAVWWARATGPGGQVVG